MNVLITGGAGYIGSCTSNILLDQGHDVTIIDNLSTGNASLIPKKAKFYKSNIQDIKKISKLLKNNNFDIIFHFAAFIKVEESMTNPKKYLKNNYENTKKFLSICKNNNLNNIIFSSTAAVYGNTNGLRAKERSKLKPESPYALSKLKVENYLKTSNYFKFIILRYFNVAGADIKLRAGQLSKKPSTHLIKRISEKSIKNGTIDIYGNNYPSKDGTTIRDYIHVTDLAEAHIQSAKYLLKNRKSNTFNCGYGKGYSILEVIKSFNSLSKYRIKYKYVNRRAGDVFSVVANASKIKKVIKWRPKYNSLKQILNSSLKWEKKFK
jgi:UDP-glucose 4-epimerase|tara:strand:+ start:11262 stop:12227 length:966 start_codon:yes stop_codon:yes gene_type:complete